MAFDTSSSSPTAASASLDKHLTGGLAGGLIALGVIALLSAFSTITLSSFISYRASLWRQYYSKDIRKNPFVLLLINLFLADFFQSFGFLFSFHWYDLREIITGSTPCNIQGFFINFGDVSSAFFVLAVALQTWAHLRFHQQIRFDIFLAIVACIWTFALVLSVLGPVTTDDYFVSTGAWCWVDAKYKSQRLSYHYFWIFLVEFGTVVVYGFVIWELRRSSVRLHNQTEVSFERATEAHRRIRRSCVVMCCYPIAYIALTLPLAISRMAELRGVETSVAYRIFCGACLVSSGMVDTGLYVATRGAFLKSHNLQQRGSCSTARTAPPTPPPTPPPKDAPKDTTAARSLARSPSPGVPLIEVDRAERIDSLEPHSDTRLTSMTSWVSNWSGQGILPQYQEQPVCAVDNEVAAQLPAKEDFVDKKF